MATPSNPFSTGAPFVDAGSAQRVRDTAREAVDDLARTASATVDRLSAGAQDTLDRVADNASDYTIRGRQFAEDARDWIAAYPWRTLGIAAAAGFLLVRIMR